MAGGVLEKMSGKNINAMLAFLLLSSGFAHAGDIFFFHGTISADDQIEPIDFHIREGFPDDFVDTKEARDSPYAYEMRLSTKDGSTVFSGVQMISFLVYAEPADFEAVNGSDVINLPERELFLKLPYEKSAEVFGIYHGGALIHSLDIPEKLCVGDGECHDYCRGRDDPDCAGLPSVTEPATTATKATGITATTAQTEVCGDLICNPERGESSLTCPVDCPSGSPDGFCDGAGDGVCDPDCNGRDPDCGISYFLGFWPYAALVFILFVVFVIYRRVKSR